MDFLSDMIARLKNGQQTGKTFTYVKQSKISIKVLQILQNEGFISHQSLVPINSKISLEKTISKKTLTIKKIKVFFKTSIPQGNSKISQYSKPFHISRISKRSRRIQITVKNLQALDYGLGIYILSTSRGLLTDRQAKILNVGGELLCKVRLFFFFYKNTQGFLKGQKNKLILGVPQV